MGTKICLNELDLFNYTTLVLKPISRSVLLELGGDVQVYHLNIIGQDDVVKEDRKRRDGTPYKLIKTYGTAYVATTFTKTNDSVVWNHGSEPKKVMIMGKGGAVDGLFVALDDVMRVVKPVVVGNLSVDDSDETDE